MKTRLFMLPTGILALALGCSGTGDESASSDSALDMMSPAAGGAPTNTGQDAVTDAPNDSPAQPPQPPVDDSPPPEDPPLDAEDPMPPPEPSASADPEKPPPDPEMLPPEEPLIEGPGFDQVYAEVFSMHSCDSGYCHGAGSGGMDSANADELFTALVGMDAAQAVCGLTQRVVPGDPESSILWMRVRPLELDDDPPCAKKMPGSSQSGLPAEQAQMVYDWILAGAKR